MDLLALAIPLAAVFVLTNFCGSSFACSPRFALTTGACLLPLLTGLLCQHLIVFAHGFGFPFTDATSQKLRTVRFPDVDPIHEEVKHTDIASVEIHLKRTTRQS